MSPRRLPIPRGPDRVPYLNYCIFSPADVRYGGPVTKRACGIHWIALTGMRALALCRPTLTDAILSALDLRLLTHVRSDSNEISPVG